MLLDVRNVSKSFGGLQALDRVTWSIEPGRIYGLIGPNGSGKTTLLNCISGFLRADSGEIRFRDQPIERLAPEKIAGLGLCRTFQLTLNPGRMTVMENMLLGSSAQKGERLLNALLRPGAVREQERDARERAYDLLARVTLERHTDELASSLSGGQKKLLALAQILMAQPQLILLDEPVAGVNPKLIHVIIEVIKRLRNDGHNFLIIEHNMAAVRELCDEVCVLDAGAVLATGEPHETLARDDVLHAYLGARADSDAAAGSSAP